MSGKVYLNGKFVDHDKAMIPVEDRGFMLGDGVYEVVRLYNGSPFYLDRHLERMQDGLNAIRINFDVKELEEVCYEIIKINDLKEANLYIQVTRGAAPRQHHFPENIRPTVLIMSYPAPPISQETRQQGVKIVLIPDERWNRCCIKTIQLLPNVLAKQQAKEAGAFEAVFYRGDIITEGSSSNIFIVKDVKIFTYPLKGNILGGVTRSVVMDIIKAEGLEVHEREFTRQELLDADEVFLTGTTTEVMPVVDVDGKKISTGKPGKITRIIAEKFEELKNKVAEGKQL